MKTLTTTIIKTRPVVRFSKKFSLQCFCSSFRFHRTVDKTRKYHLITKTHTQWTSAQTSAFYIILGHKSSHYIQISCQQWVDMYLIQGAGSSNVNEWTHRNDGNPVFNFDGGIWGERGCLSDQLFTKHKGVGQTRTWFCIVGLFQIRIRDSLEICSLLYEDKLCLVLGLNLCYFTNNSMCFFYE